MNGKWRWCRVGPEGTSLMWGSHGCMIGDHSSTNEPHIHQCAMGGVPCCEFDDRTGQVRFADFEGWGAWQDYGSIPWWQ